MAAHGCNTHTQRAAAQAAESRPDCSGHGDLAAGARKAPKRARIGQAPKPWVGFPAESEALMSQGNLKGSPTGGFAEQASNTARGTLERKRTCGTQKYRTAARPGLAVPLRCREMPKPVGLLDPRRPARPRTYFRGATGRMTRAQARRGERWRLCEN